MKHSDKLKAAKFISNNRRKVVGQFLLWKESAAVYVGMAVGIKVTVSNLRSLLRMPESFPAKKPSNKGSNPDCPGMKGERWSQRIKPHGHVLNRRRPLA